jgi:translation initiation factor IF-2
MPTGEQDVPEETTSSRIGVQRRAGRLARTLALPCAAENGRRGAACGAKPRPHPGPLPKGEGGRSRRPCGDRRGEGGKERRGEPSQSRGRKPADNQRVRTDPATRRPGPRVGGEPRPAPAHRTPRRLAGTRPVPVGPGGRRHRHTSAFGRRCASHILDPGSPRPAAHGEGSEHPAPTSSPAQGLAFLLAVDPRRRWNPGPTGGNENPPPSPSRARNAPTRRGWGSRSRPGRRTRRSRTRGSGG